MSTVVQYVDVLCYLPSPRLSSPFAFPHLWSMTFLLSVAFLSCSFFNSSAAFLRSKSWKYKRNKTGVINDPLGQPTVPAGSDCRLILKLWDGRTYGLTDTLCENSDHYRPGTVVGLVNQKTFLFIKIFSLSWCSHEITVTTTTSMYFRKSFLT